MLPHLLSIGPWGSIAAYGGAQPLDGDAGVLKDCLESKNCSARVSDQIADTLRDAAVASEGLAVGLSPAIVRGEGLTIELSAQSLAIPGPEAPDGVDIAPVVPRVAIGGVTGRRLRAGGGLQGGLAAPLDATDTGFTFGGRGGLAFGSPEEQRWVGFELDVGYGIVMGDLFDDRARAARELAGKATDVPACPDPCIDVVNLLHAGIDSVFTFDIDQTTALFGRVGGVFQLQSIDVSADTSRWGWSGFLPRAVLGAAYRSKARTILSAAVRFGRLEPNESPGTELLWLASLGIGYRFGPDAPIPQPIPPPKPPAPPPTERKPILVPKIPVMEHPDLDCGPERIPTGAPPPVGLEGWCVLVNDEGMVLLDGPYRRWHDADHIAVQGENRLGRPSGLWTELDPTGALLSYGSYSDGLKEGVWRTYYPSGQPQIEGSYHRGLQSGMWMTWTEDGKGMTEGNYINGVRSGSWRDFRDDLLVRIREYRDGNLISDELIAIPR